MNTHRMAARIFGIFFLITFISYGLGNGLVESITNAPDMLTNVFVNKTQVIVGVILMALIHTFVNIGLPIIMLPILKPYNEKLAYGYLGAAITATVVLAVGAIFLLMLLPLSDEYVKAGSAIAPFFETMGIILKKGNFFAYQIGMATWGMGGLMFCYLLYQSKLVPRPMSVWGFTGYVIFISGTIFELFGYNVGVILSIPGGLFEISLSVWLIVKGFSSSAIGSRRARMIEMT